VLSAESNGMGNSLQAVERRHGIASHTSRAAPRESALNFDRAGFGSLLRRLQSSLGAESTEARMVKPDEMFDPPASSRLGPQDAGRSEESAARDGSASAAKEAAGELHSATKSGGPFSRGDRIQKPQSAQAVYTTASAPNPAMRSHEQSSGRASAGGALGLLAMGTQNAVDHIGSLVPAASAKAGANRPIASPGPSSSQPMTSTQSSEAAVSTPQLSQRADATLAEKFSEVLRSDIGRESAALRPVPAADRTARGGTPTPSKGDGPALASNGETDGLMKPSGREIDSVEPTPFDKLIRSIRLRTGEKLSTAQLRLNPPDLGRLVVDVRMEGARLTVDVRTETAAARDLLQDRVAQLKGALEYHEIPVHSIGFRVGLVENRSAALLIHGLEDSATRNLFDGKDDALDEPSARGEEAYTPSVPMGRGRVLRRRLVDLKV